MLSKGHAISCGAGQSEHAVGLQFFRQCIGTGTLTLVEDNPCATRSVQIVCIMVCQVVPCKPVQQLLTSCYNYQPVDQLVIVVINKVKLYHEDQCGNIGSIGSSSIHTRC